MVGLDLATIACSLPSTFETWAGDSKHAFFQMVHTKPSQQKCVRLSDVRLGADNHDAAVTLHAVQAPPGSNGCRTVTVDLAPQVHSTSDGSE
eukprot:15475539-Alexandrium_andersonii.AAC.1